jgi:hypothetical protein
LKSFPSPVELVVDAVGAFVDVIAPPRFLQMGYSNHS